MPSLWKSSFTFKSRERVDWRGGVVKRWIWGFFMFFFKKNVANKKVHHSGFLGVFATFGQNLEKTTKKNSTDYVGPRGSQMAIVAKTSRKARKKHNSTDYVGPRGSRRANSVESFVFSVFFWGFSRGFWSFWCPLLCFGGEVLLFWDGSKGVLWHYWFHFVFEMVPDDECYDISVWECSICVCIFCAGCGLLFAHVGGPLFWLLTGLYTSQVVQDFRQHPSTVSLMFQISVFFAGRFRWWCHNTKSKSIISHAPEQHGSTN